MNIAALILALVGAGLSMFQPVIPYMNISVSDLLSSGNSDLSAIGTVVLIIACVAVISGIAAVMRKNKTACSAWLVVCGSMLLLSGAFFSDNSSQMQNIPFNFRGFAMSQWMKTVFVWALCYLVSAVCVYLDDYPEASTSSAPENTQALTPSLASSPSPTVQPQPKTFEPILGVQTPALIKRALLFLGEDDFDEAKRYSEQALRQDPENSGAYMAKLMAQLKVHNTDELCKVDVPIGDNRLFQYALRFASDDEKAAIQKCLDDNTEHLEDSKQEQQKYMTKNSSRGNVRLWRGNVKLWIRNMKLWKKNLLKLYAYHVQAKEIMTAKLSIVQQKYLMS